MSRYSGMDPRKRRVRIIVLVTFIAVMCGMIAWSQWYAVHHNIPYYERKIEHK
ncbi:MAG: hypothetical protein ACXWNK_12240 [Vulcanimicrobiaceae bacterium]